MGRSTDAILFYGIDLGLAEEHGLFGEYGWEVLYLERAHQLTLESSDWNAVWEFIQKHEGLVRTSPCFIGDVGEYEDSMVDYVALRSAHFKVYCAELTPVETKIAIPQAEADAQIKAFCDLLEIPYTQPKWLLGAINQ